MAKKENYTKKEVLKIMATIMASLKQSENDGAIIDTLFLKNNGQITLWDYLIDIINE